MTIEQTEKKWKVLDAIGSSLMFVFMVPAILCTLAQINFGAVMFWVLFLLAWCIRLYAKAGIWWNHQ